LSTAEQVAGFCYLPFFVFLLAWLLQYCSGLFDLGLTGLQLGMIRYAVNCAVIWIIFRRFLTRSFRAVRFWELVQAVILGAALFVAGKLLLDQILRLVGQSTPAYNADLLAALPTDNFWVTTVCCLLLTPVVEETLFRGLIFGTIRRKSRIAAYAIMVLSFALVHIWRGFLDADLAAVLMAALPYLPAGIALGWTYEKSNTVWAPILLHMGINAFAMGLIPV
jgi:membrane protease YdiL (CAAX protease family)